MVYSEAELIENLAEHMKMARETSRALAHMRKDKAWLDVSQLLDDMRLKLMKLAVAGKRGLILS